MYFLLKYLSGIVFAAILLLFTVLPGFSQTEYTVIVDPSTAAITKVDSIPGVTWLRGFYIPTYCENTHRYTFIGGDDKNGDPFYLFTIDAISGKTISNPLFANHDDLGILQYSGSGDILYGIVWKPSGASLVSVNTTTATYSIIRDIPILSNILQFIVDDIHNRFIMIGGDITGKLTLLTMDISTGNIISQAQTSRVNNLVYNKLTNKFYALSNRDGETPQDHVIFSFGTVDPNTGTVSIIADIPNLAGFNPGNETLNEKGGLYHFTGFEWNVTADYLYSIDITSGNIVYKHIIPMRNILYEDNLINFRYDNNFEKLYALYWEALTVKPPFPYLDSSCRLDIQTQVYPNPFDGFLIVQKNPTICNVRMNLYNELGQLMIRDRIINNGKNEIPLGNFSSGMYFYTLYSNNRILLTGKIMKQ